MKIIGDGQRSTDQKIKRGKKEMGEFKKGRQKDE